MDYSNNKRSLFKINLINCTIYIPKDREFKKKENISINTKNYVKYVRVE